MATRKRFWAQLYSGDKVPFWTQYPGYGVYQTMPEQWHDSSEASTIMRQHGAMYMERLWPGDKTAPWYGGVDEERCNLPAFRLLPEPVGGIVLRPYFDITQQPDLNYFKNIGELGEFWNDMATLRHWPYIQMTSSKWPGVGETGGGGVTLTAGLYTGLETRFKLPRMPTFAFALYRTDHPVFRDEDGKEQPYPEDQYGFLCTKVTFCETSEESFMLLIPYDSAPQMLWKHESYTHGEWTRLRSRSQFSVHTEQSLFGQRDAQFALIWITCVPNGIIVTCGDPESGASAFYPMPHHIIDSTIYNPTGSWWFMGESPVRLESNCGHWGFVWLPILMKQQGTTTPDDDDDIFEEFSVKLYGRIVPTHYDITATKDELLRSTAMITPCLNDDGDIYSGSRGRASVYVRNITEPEVNPPSRIADEQYGMEWAAGFVSYDHQSSFNAPASFMVPYEDGMRNPSENGMYITYRHHISPILYSVSWAGVPKIQEQSVTYTEVSGDRLTRATSISREHTDASEGSAVLEDNDATAIANVRSIGLPYKLRNNVLYDDDSTSTHIARLGQLHVANQHMSVSEDGFEANIRLGIQEWLIRLYNAVFGPDEPSMDTWYVRDAIAYCLLKAGIPETYWNIDDTVSRWHGLEDTGRRLMIGERGMPMWKPQDGRTVLSFIKELNEYNYCADLRVTYDNATEQFYITTCCPYCGVKRTSLESPGLDEDTYQNDIGWVGKHSHWHNPTLSAGCTEVDISKTESLTNPRSDGIMYWVLENRSDYTAISGLTQDDVILQAEATDITNEYRLSTGAGDDVFANKVVVRGPVPGGRQSHDMLETVIWAWESIYLYSGTKGANWVGREVAAQPIERAWLGIPETAAPFAHMKLGLLSGRPEFVTVELPYITTLQRGDTIAFYGTDTFLERELMASATVAKKYRVISAEGQLTRGELGTHRIEARYAGTVEIT